MVSSARRARNKVMVLTNAKGGPRLVHEAETVDLSAQETVDGKPPAFKIMSPRAASKYLDKHERGIPRPLAELTIDRDNIRDTKFLRLVHESDGHLTPYHVDRWYRDIEEKIHVSGGASLTDEEIARLDREGWVAKVEITVDKSADQSHDMLELASDLAELQQAIFADELPPITSLPGANLEQLRYDRIMLSHLADCLRKDKPATPAQHAYAGELFSRYKHPGISHEALTKVVTAFAPLMVMKVQGEGELYKWPTLADEVIHAALHPKQLITNQTIKRLNNILTQCDKLVLDNMAVRRIAEAFQAFPEQIAQNAQFVGPPFETCWIELPNRMWVDFLGLHTTNDVDDRLGYLFVKGRAYVCFQGKGLSPHWCPIVYELNTVPNQGKLAKEFARVNGAPEDLSRFYMGDTLLKLAGEGVALSLRGQHGFTVLNGPQSLSKLDWGGFAGELPIIVSILLAINTPSQQVIKYTDMPKRWRTTHKGKKAIHAHRIVTIDLDRAPGVRLISREADDEREKRHVGWHTVRGHWMHDRRYREVRLKGLCDHGPNGGEWWTEYAPGKFECLNCGAHRTWRTYPNGRGDPDKPVEHHYHVKG